MGELINQIFTGFSDAIEGISNGLKDAFLNIIYVDPTASEKVVSEFAKFAFVMFGLSLAFTIVFLIVRKIKG
ncbi:unknown [Staphylococcus sp. CAG:324]|nr:unknown [Staphylococcus sp. CAG:324]